MKPPKYPIGTRVRILVAGPFHAVGDSGHVSDVGSRGFQHLYWVNVDGVNVNTLCFDAEIEVLNEQPKGEK